jgi:thiol-disulfide isomerase/thioredoxin
MPQGNLPLFELPEHPGTIDLWQQREMLVALLHGSECAPCRALAAALDGYEDSWDREHVGVVIVHLDDHELAAIRDALFAQLVPRGVTAGEPCVAISDRFGLLYAAIPIHDRPTEEVVREAREWIDFIQERCDECGAPMEWR